MSLTFSLDFRKELTRENSADIPISLLTFTHPDMPEAVPVSSDETVCLSVDPYMMGTISRGTTFYYVPMGLVLPGEDEAAAPQMKISIAAIDRSIIRAIRSTGTPASALFELVYASDPDTVVFSLDYFELVSAPYDQSQVTLVLSQEAFWSEPWPRGVMTPTWFPGLHR